MMYKFKSQATGDLVMTQPVGDRVLSLIGKGASAQGIIDVDQLPAAISSLEAAVAAESPHPGVEDDEAQAKSGFGADHVGLRQRVWPMVEMMKQALAEKQPIVWGV
ncbi:MAG: DUF1840 domain-containing protein [Betaproteobacteria bacterium]